MALHDSVREYYFGHLTDLPVDKQFHFASRLSAWEANATAKQILEDLRPEFVPAFPADGALREILQNIITHPPAAKINAADTRAPYFAKYPTLRGVSLAMFRVRHWLTIYDVDARDAFFKAIEEDELTALEKKLLKDADAMRVLSTYAINFIYLYERVALEQPGKDAIRLKKLYKVAKGYNLKDCNELRLCIQFYTHCIIAESNFYLESLPGFGMSVYIRMLKRTEKIISKHFQRLGLDSKLEFLVCCRLCDYDTKLEADINAECAASLNDAGTYLVDKHNVYAGSGQTSLADSEHRNMLYILSASRYHPMT